MKSLSTINIRIRKEQIVAYWLVAPTLIVILIFVYYPALQTLLCSFTSLNLKIPWKTRFIGLSNYIMVLREHSFWLSVYRTAFTIGIALPIEIMVGLGGALLLNKGFRGRGVGRTLTILPWMLPPVVNGFMWGWILNGDYGALNGLLYQLGIISSYKKWLGSPLGQIFWVSFAQSWTRYSFVMLVLLGSLQSISPELYDAAKIDGGNTFQCFWHITFPLLRPAFTIALTVEFIMAFQMFDVIWALTGGGSTGTVINPFTKTLMVLSYELVFRKMDIGLGSAVAYLMLLFSLGVGFLIIKYMYYREATR